MTRRNQQQRREEAQARKRAEAELANGRGSYRPPPRDQCMERYYDRPVGDSGLFQLHVRFWRKDGATTEFVLVLQEKVWDGWVDRARIDCCHGACHFHADDDEPMSTIVKTLDSVADVEKAWPLAEIEISTHAATMKIRGENDDD